MTITSDDKTVVPFPKKGDKATSSIERIWGKPTLSHGFTGVPSILIRAQSRIGISAMQMNIILQLLDYWIEPARKPFPTKKDLANRIGVSDKTIQTNIGELEKAGLIQREYRRTASGDFNSNIYHLDGLIERVKRLEPEFSEARRKRMEAEKARRDVETPLRKRS